MSKAEIVVFMTQDAVPADEYVIGNLVKVLEEDEMTGAAYARQLAASDCNYIEKYIRKFNYPENSRIKSKEDVLTFVRHINGIFMKKQVDSARKQYLMRI